MIDSTRELFRRLGSFFRRTELDEELDVELAAHMELAVEENLKRGMTAQEARRQALIRFGGRTLAREQHNGIARLFSADHNI